MGPKRFNFGSHLTFWPLRGLSKSFSEHQVYVTWNTSLLSHFMKKTKTFWCLVLKIFSKRFIFRPNLTFWPPGGLGKSFSEHHMYVCWNTSLLSHSWEKWKNSGVSFWRYFRKGSFLGQNWPFDPLWAWVREFFWTRHVCFLKHFIIAAFHEKNGKILASRSEDIFVKFHFWAEIDLLTPWGACTRVFPNMTHVSWSALLLSNFMQINHISKDPSAEAGGTKNEKILASCFKDIFENVHF